MRDLDSNLLRTFVTVAETGAVGTAAQRLARTQAAVSMQLRRLEEDLERRLFDRSPRGLRLTEAGHLLLPYAHGILGAGADARRALSISQVAGTVRLGLLEDIAVGSLPRALHRFSAAYPHITLEITIDSSAAMSARLLDGALDIVIGDSQGIDAQPQVSWNQPLFWVGARGLVLDPDLSSRIVPLVTFGGTCLWQPRVAQTLKQAGIAWRVVCSSTSLPAVQSAVEAGLGIAVLLESNVHPQSMRVLGPLDGLPPAPTVDFGLYVRRVPAAQAAAVRALQRFLEEELNIAATLPLDPKTADALPESL
ncbi:LysR family transcriptional regulator [Pseudomonas gingeri NCPPB 3146 = LMG 5327]|uniref:LysR family transcriptional regulator n=5 Tax=Pseudomonas gingeri TaxID=117681 RepID=A0A7Y7XVG4_9PSED|nr:MULTISPECIES: LysR substrate-binding domain-containing protein [Pseudomonas]NVZ29697.1 LysR family transcriptional regulator [Pseudomonas gingeri]NVZ65364.1 LysR family transcriptional regulator [Pseudomonas gingeri]NVZ79426.1 LysR family transcriptional regulator [Pseudomonas gingeri]NWA08424.1 LysR family transcriptional regulator [Pseudomonas gingeri]NWC13067.1 LysR family transcriptional regulator [Pseudomonas gingeri]